MAQRLPLEPSVPSYRFSTTLDGTQHVFDVHWNGRDGAWYFDVLTTDGEIIRAGVKVVLGAWLGRHSVDPRYPLGVLVADDQSGERRDAGLDDLGARVIVQFLTFGEVAAL